MSPSVDEIIHDRFVPEGKEERHHLFVFLNHDYGEISSSLYRIEVPPDVSSSSEHCKRLKEPQDCIEPILEFRYPEYPRDMCCVELKSKFYFFGGHLRDEGSCIYNLPERNYPLNIHVFDTTRTLSSNSTTTTTTTTSNDLLQKREIPSMKTGKPFPYAFIAKGCIFVFDNSSTYSPHRPTDSLFEVYKPGQREWKQLPDPPLASTVCGHAFTQGKLFLSCQGGGRRGYVLCFNVNKRVWIQHIIQGLEEGHIFYGEAKLMNDTTLYALSGFTGTTPAAYVFKPRLVTHYTSHLSSADEDADLFDDLALAATSLEGVSHHVFLDWLSANLVHLGRGCFCYVRGGQFPNHHYPKYEGIVLSYFKPHHETFTEVLGTSNFNSFTGDFLHSSHLKIKPSNPAKPAFTRSCFFVSNKIPMRP